MKAVSDTALLIEPVGKGNVEELAALYFRRGPFLKFRNAQIVEEYLRRNIELKSYLHGYVLRKSGKVVGSSLLVRTAANTGALLFTVTDEAFAGPERLAGLGRAYRESIKVLLENGITTIQNSAPRSNPTAIGYSLATGYIQFAESDTTANFETYLPLLASVISKLSGVGLDRISLLKLAGIAGNPKKTDDTSHTFAFDFKRKKYGLKVDRLSKEMESLSCPEFSIGFGYPKPSGWTNRKFKARLVICNPTPRAKEFRFTLRMNEAGSRRIIHREKRSIQPGESLKHPLEFVFDEAGRKTLTAEVAVDRKTFVLSKAFVIQKSLSIVPNLAEMSVDSVALNIRNNTKRKARAVVSAGRGSRKRFRKEVVLDSGTMGSMTLSTNDIMGQRAGAANVQVRVGRAGTVLDIDIIAGDGIIHFTDGRDDYFGNGRVVVGFDRVAGILHFQDATDPKCIIYQLPEELGPPFSEYGNTRFQSMPVSCRPAGILPGAFLAATEGIRAKPSVGLENGCLVIRYGLSGHKGISVEKRISFRGQDIIEVSPKIVMGRSGSDISTKIVFRNCLKIMTDTSMTVPIYENSSPTRFRLSDNPYLIDQLLLEGRRPNESWSALEFSGSKKCAGLIWHGDPEYDFFPLWFNKAPWLIYDVNLEAGREMVFPSQMIVFRDGTWKTVKSICDDTLKGTLTMRR